MRSKDKIRTIKQALGSQQTLTLEGTNRMSGSVFSTSNWTKVGRALEILIDDGLMLDYRDTDQERFLSETISEFPYDSEHSIQINQYHELTQHLQTYTHDLPRVVLILERLYPADTDDRDDVEEFAVELNIAGHGSIDDTLAKFERVTKLFGTYLTLDRQPSIKGFDKGSDWVVLEAANGLPVDFIVLTFACAKDVMDTLAQMPRDVMSLAVKTVVNMMSSDKDGQLDEDQATSDALRSHFDNLKSAAIDQMIANLKNSYQDDETVLNEGRQKADKAVDQIIGLHNDGVTFQIPEESAQRLKLEITGNNNTVILGGNGPIFLPPPTAPDDDSDSYDADGSE